MVGARLARERAAGGLRPRRPPAGPGERGGKRDDGVGAERADRMAESLVFIHGSGDSAALWDTTIAAVPGVTCAALDLPGHGALIGEPGPERLSVADYTTLARMAMERLDLQGLCV